MAQLMSLQMELAELDRKSERLAKAELAALQAQISPHFVYNTLNTIAAVHPHRARDAARQLLADFADFLRRTFRRQEEFARSPRSWSTSTIPEFEKARFGERLNVVYRSPRSLSARAGRWCCSRWSRTPCATASAARSARGGWWWPPRTAARMLHRVDDDGVGMAGDGDAVLHAPRPGSGLASAWRTLTSGCAACTAPARPGDRQPPRRGHARHFQRPEDARGRARVTRLRALLVEDKPPALEELRYLLRQADAVWRLTPRLPLLTRFAY